MTKLQIRKGMEKGVLEGDCVGGTGDARGSEGHLVIQERRP